MRLSSKAPASSPTGRDVLLVALVLALSSCEPALVTKAGSGDAAGVKALLAKPVDQQTKNEALIEAVTAGHADAAAALLDGGADPASKDEIGSNALTIAIRRGDAAAARVLLDHRADPASAVEVYALATPDVARALSDHGADPNAKDSSGASALAHAACDGKVELVRLWLARGADPDKAGRACLRSHFDVDRIGTVCDQAATPLECAKTKGYGEIAGLLEAAPRR